MESITLIILTKNEEKNIEKCIASAWQIAQRVVVVDCGSTDRTVALAEENGAQTYFHPWEGHARQFNWALDHCQIETPWVFRLDADERISEELAGEIREKLSTAESTDGFSMRWRVYFMNRWIRHGGTHKPYFLRLFRFGKGRAEDKLMDEHILVDGRVERLTGDLIHYDYKGLDAWLNKHVWYSGLELAMYQQGQPGANKAQKQKRGFYYRLPLFLRARLYFWYRYYVQLGFLDGRPGKVFCFLQAYWYRFLVDAKIYEARLGENNEG